MFTLSISWILTLYKVSFYESTKFQGYKVNKNVSINILLKNASFSESNFLVEFLRLISNFVN